MIPNRTHLISIIIPVYNVEAYLARCISSVLNQTYSNLEIILVDDGSLDNCPKMCDEYEKQDLRVKVFHKANGGLSDARNFGTEQAQGKYIYYLDSDDELPLNAIALMSKVIDEFPDTEIVVGKMIGIPDKDLYYNTRFDAINYINDNTWIRKNFSRLKDSIPSNACNKLILKSFITENSLYFQKGLIHEDELWMFQVSQVLTKIAFAHGTTYFRYINPGSITTGTPSLSKKQAWGIILNEIFPKINQPAFFEQFSKYGEILKQKQPFSKDSCFDLYKRAWTEYIKCAQRNKHPFIALSLWAHSFLHPILKGHGTGFIIWLILTKFYGKQYRSVLD